jgi:GAF domain-containing protein
MDLTWQANEMDRTMWLRWIEDLVTGESNHWAVLANTSALLFALWPGINWLGLYVLEAPGGDLVVGPFQGKPACTRIPMGRGVVGQAAMRCEPLVVPDVQRFEGHIACDPDSRSELVVPMCDASEHLRAVWDVDSPYPDHFQDEDVRFLTAVAERFRTRWSELH